ncbi:MAG TPA: FlgD immunoglobulin-like domain containing protein [Verrucomicrobiae bacterium]|nr:FlgD immunoglobulin-like domain containing protein [Verrucomicrobiae bacterium]
MGRLLLITTSLLFSTNLLFGQGSYLNIMGIIRGDSAGAQFGKMVVPAGDVNGDTLQDFLVGAFHCCPNDLCCPPRGAQKVYLFYGKKDGFDTIPDLIFQHKAQLECLGDLNGDGQADFGMRESGQKYRFSVYYGGAGLDTFPDGYVKGDSSDIFDQYGLDVSVGKWNDLSDHQIALGVTFTGVPGSDSLRFYCYNVTQNSIDSVAFWKPELPFKSVFGGRIRMLGDVDGDGFADLAVGRESGSDAVPGTVEIYLGGITLDTIPDIILYPPSSVSSTNRKSFGRSVFGVGDLNGDGRAEFIVTAPYTPLLYFGGNPLDTLPRFVLDRLGDHFANGGDINADGYSDLLMGRDESPLTGFAYVYYGGPSMDSVRDLEIHERDLPYPASGFGQTVAGLGDVDGDGSNDFAVGSTSNLVADQDYGYLWVFRGLQPSTGVNDEKHNIPRHFTLEQNYPNPFNSTTLISYTLSRRAQVRLGIFNIAGQLVKVLVDEEQSAGSHQISWGGEDSKGRPMPSGIYLYKLSFEDEVQVKKMVLVK